MIPASLLAELLEEQVHALLYRLALMKAAHGIALVGVLAAIRHGLSDLDRFEARAAR